MIKTKEDLNEYLSEDLKYYYSMKNTFQKRVKAFISGDVDYRTYRLIKSLRKSEYYMNVSKDGSTFILKKILCRVLYLFNKRTLNKRSAFLGIEIQENCFDKGLTIYHPNGIVVHKDAVIGKNCKFHGNNCIGNSGNENSKAPRIGNNVDIGVGARIIGDIEIADDIIIGAGAVVNKSFTEKGITIAGVPAVKIK